MDDSHYHPPLLSLQDMLNLSDDDNEDWSDNPYNISNFFEPIVPVSVAGQGVTSSTTASGSSSQATSSGYDSLDPFDGIGSSGRDDFSQSHGNYIQFAEEKTEADPESVPETQEDDEPKRCDDDGQNDNRDDYGLFDIFDEEMVTSELGGCEQASTVEESTEVESQYEEILPDIPSQDSPKKKQLKKPIKQGRSPSPVKRYREKLPQTQTQSKGPTLKEVTFEDDLKTRVQNELRKKYRKEAIAQLTYLINSLKRYSNQLQDFLANEGNLILEHYNAKTMLRGIIPDVIESTPTKEIDPFKEARLFKNILHSHANGRTFFNTMPLRKAYIWKGSDLILLQKTILESVIHQREFFLNCRYTDLLTEMGFDTEDLESLSKCVSKEAELGMLKIIMNEHDFFSKLQNSHKKQIKTTIIREDYQGSGIPRVMCMPSPDKLVEEKWKALREIRRATVLSKIKDEDINWLYVLKNLTEKNPKLDKVDETTCKLTYDHLISLKYNNDLWTYNEVFEVKRLRNSHPKDSWAKLADRLGTKRSPFACFLKYRMYCSSSYTVNQVVPPQEKYLVEKCFEETMGNAAQVDYMLSRVLKKHYMWTKPRRLIMYASILLNPRKRLGKFSLVEDILLLVVMEKYKDHIVKNDGNMNPIAYCMPWRNITNLKQRFSTLFMTFYFKAWKYEDDLLLIELVETHGPNYKKIQRYIPTKDRKQLRARYNHLQRVLQTTELTLGQYHFVSQPNRKSLRVGKFFEMIQYLEAVIKSKSCGNMVFVRDVDLEFLKLRRKPTEHNLESYLMTFPIDLLVAALNRLVDCVAYIASKWKGFKGNGNQGGKAQNYASIDRRKFDPKCAMSLGSALNLRNATLVPEERLGNMTEFETEVYSAYKFFTWRVTGGKGRTHRPGIPTLEVLRKLPSISRLIEQPVNEYKPGQPSLIVTIKTETPDKEEIERRNQEVLKELEDKKKGGRLKGSKRKNTLTKEKRKMAANLRWENQRLAAMAKAQDSGGDVGSNTTRKENIPCDSSSEMVDSPFMDQISAPCTPATPASMISISTNASVDSESTSGTGTSMRKNILGMISDHTYSTPVENPIDWNFFK